jgi:hypothetical protein
MLHYSRLAIWTYLTLLVCNVQAQIKVLAPDSLKRHFQKTNGVILGATSIFGAPFYGERVLGRLRGSTTQGRSHCKENDYELAELAQDDLNAQGEKVLDILVIPHNSIACSAVSKVMIAENKGAHAVILVDQTGQPDEKVKENYPQDDGYGSQIKIPSILVSQTTGETLFAAMRQDPVVVELEWDIPVKEVAALDFWHSSASSEAENFLKRFKEPAELMGNLMEFIPRYYIFEVPAGVGAGDLCADTGSSSAARHCAPDPDGPGPITGRDVANEDIRQLCLFHLTAAQQSADATVSSLYSYEWWEYVTRLFNECPLDATERPNRFGSNACSLKVMGNLGVDLNKITTCVAHDAERILEEQARNQAWSEQALRVNGWRYKGSLDAELVLKAVCQSFPMPVPQCDMLLSGTFSRTMYLLSHRIAKGVSERTFELLIVGILILGVINCYLYKRCLMRLVKSQMREEVMLEVQSQMADYSKLEA